MTWWLLVGCALLGLVLLVAMALYAFAELDEQVDDALGGHGREPRRR